MKFTVLCSNRVPIKEFFFSRTTSVSVLKVSDVTIQVTELTGKPMKHHTGT